MQMGRLSFQVGRFASPNRFTTAGSRWSKKLLVLVSSVAIADGFFIAIRSRSINQTIARANRFVDASLAFFGIRYLKNAKPEQRHRHAIIQGNRWN
jgi:hypothetical protein